MGLSRVVKIWAGPIRAPFLLLSVMLVLIGGAVALADGVFDGLRFGLAMAGVILAHGAVNMLNEYSDHRTGVDDKTRRTPFSGGSGTLQAGNVRPRSVLIMATGFLAVALGIGVYLSWLSDWYLLIFIGIGGAATIFYTSHLARWMVGELAAGGALGTCVVLGAYYAQAGALTQEVIWLSVPPGLLTAVLLLLNEFPDVEADRSGGRRHLVIMLGKRWAAIVYTLTLLATYAILVTGAVTGLFPMTVLLALITIPLALKACVTALRHHGSFEKMLPALGANVGVVLATDLLIAVGYFVG